MGKVTATLPPPLEDKLEQEHEQTGIDKSEIVRQAVKDKLMRGQQ